MSVDDGAVRRLTDTPGPEFGPDYSPDGRWIAYTAGVRPRNTRDSPMENDQIWLIPSGGGAAQNLTGSLDRRVRGFQWSGDSQQLFFRAENEGSIHLYRVAVTSGHIDAVVTDEGEITSFIVSPTMDRIAYRMVGRSRAPEIYAMMKDEEVWGEPVRMSYGDGPSVLPHVAANGERVCVAWTDHRDGNPEIYRLRADGSDPRRLTHGRSTESSPCWSPDGRRVAFVSDRSRTTQVAIPVSSSCFSSRS